ncbi:MAG: tRNA 2-thiouridine(34) synthase MnmA [Omnitrophica bacterium RBG_13_46_9]|nr:MAG: tRNA 2-thiouridine(34) synthase MnmA [Omnitrophica bacterium RBG_13_46_9]
MVKLKKRVLVAMSGGVDSSVASYLLKESGFEVTGVTMCFGVKEVNKKRPACCGEQAINDAKSVCRKLGIPHYALDFSRQLEKEVINRFVSEYKRGRTPNPCVECNRSLKFGILFEKARSLGFDFLATGHYARIAAAIPTPPAGKRSRRGIKKGLRYVLKKAKDTTKDQSYFLYPIRRNALESVLFPLGELTKKEVRDIAKKICLPVAEKPQSQDICFIPGKNYHEFLFERIDKPTRGPILDLKGKVLGEHKGVFLYTIGQRGGLGIGYKYPLYVLLINTEKNQIVVGEKKDLKAKGLVAGEVNLLVEDMPRKISAKIRYNQKEAKCEIFPEKAKIKVVFEEPQEAVTPGQSVVFYDGDVVLGGGVIEQAIR